MVACGSLILGSLVRRSAVCERTVVEEATCEDDKALSEITVEDLSVDKVLECLIIAKMAPVTETPGSVGYSFDKSGNAASVKQLSTTGLLLRKKYCFVKKKFHNSF